MILIRVPAMRLRSWILSACLVAGSPAVQASDLPLPPGEISAEVVSAGRELFTMNFARPSSTKFKRGLGHNGNGLGPLFNETSCVACHSQGGVGGAGDLSH